MGLGNEAASRRVFHTLDGVRGVAALAVVLYHYNADVAPIWVGSAYLAVDLFFALSGFVLAHAYERRLQAGTGPGAFLLMRVVRLYPLYLLGTAIALVPAVGALLLGRAQTWAWGSLAWAVPTALLMLPAPPLANRLPRLYPLDVPAWSLFFELIVNLAYALLLRFGLGRTVPAIAAIAALVAVVSGIAFGSLDGGSQWPDVAMGAVRVSVSFFIGVLLCRLHAAGRLPAIRCPAWALLAAAAGLLAVSPSPPWRPAYDLICVLALFPALIAVAVVNEPRRGARACAVLGLVSYPIYTIHVPCQTLLLSTVHRLAGDRAAQLAPFSGLALVVLLFILSWVLASSYDPIVRQWLGRRVGLSVPRVP
jgi:peptidoglycan/LPS O-acetylase OafA/YrhL